MDAANPYITRGRCWARILDPSKKLINRLAGYPSEIMILQVFMIRSSRQNEEEFMAAVKLFQSSDLIDEFLKIQAHDCGLLCDKNRKLAQKLMQKLISAEQRRDYNVQDDFNSKFDPEKQKS
uniref:Uncharacterized protein n=1 Tax=Romanomermis culicivorax TaxID=13658 RepID=A0A915L7V6_ROMCU